MAYIVLEVNNSSTKDCTTCPFLHKESMNCNLPTNFPFCEEVDYTNMKIILKETLNLEKK